MIYPGFPWIIAKFGHLNMAALDLLGKKVYHRLPEYVLMPESIHGKFIGLQRTQSSPLSLLQLFCLEQGLSWGISSLAPFISNIPIETTGISILYAYNFWDLFGTIKWGCWLLGGWDSSNGWRMNAMTRLSSKQWFAVQYNRSWDGVLMCTGFLHHRTAE